MCGQQAARQKSNLASLPLDSSQFLGRVDVQHLETPRSSVQARRPFDPISYSVGHSKIETGIYDGSETQKP